ncbi:DUF397 domain-containing protein [Sphaerisporangium sp. NPDC088356]|uniref:DUF397 domain-containing protein n=1 Tax=Sphaerisporangium sp. NPDC088356 TaxID=3154871 RepID=UPI00342837F4
MDHLNDELRDAAWFKSSYSGSSGGDCVEVAALPGARVGVRDSKDPAGPALIFTGCEWDLFRRGLGDGRLAV